MCENISIFGDEFLKLIDSYSLISITNQLLLKESVVSDDGVSEIFLNDRLDNLKISESLRCNTCETDLVDRDDQISHYKCDWHRYNLKCKLKNLNIICENEFEEIQNCDVSSISGSDTDSDCDNINEENSEKNNSVELVHRQPKIFLKHSSGKFFSIYRCILCNKKNEPETENENKLMINKLPLNNVWSILMLSGGHFAGAVFEKGILILHKTFHRYVVRAKRGTVQSSHDKKGGNAKSAGANLRRYNEYSLTQKVQNVIQEWSDKLKSCSRIFIRCAPSSKNIIFSLKNPCLSRDDPRISSLPFPTRRPTMKEIQRVYDKLSNCNVFINIFDHVDFIPSPKKIKQPCKMATNTKKVQIPKSSRKQSLENETSSSETDDSNSDLILVNETFITRNLMEYECDFGDSPVKNIKMDSRNDIFTCCKTGDIQKLNELLKMKECLDILNEPFGKNKVTFMHIASLNKQGDVIKILLDSGCDPAIRDKRGIYPYIAADKRTRLIFRKYRNENPEKYNYQAAEIPFALTDQQEAAKQEKEIEKRRAMKQKKREREKARKAEEKIVNKEIEERTRFLNLTDREKRLLAAEKRLATQMVPINAQLSVLNRCFLCGNDMAGKIPYEYCDFKFCTVDCLKLHKLKK